MKRSVITMVAVAIAVLASSFTVLTKTQKTKSNRVVRTWYFDSNALADANEASAWTLEEPDGHSCDGDALPCTMDVDADDETELGNFLNGKSDEDIRDIYADTQRNAI
ncbi:hypothetical protein [Mucilaginibacter terrae]|uniref:Uncharacterized protein n=1 Tax=Mucilaginibacter terrae TaxID=1955052 RepID=A0ABU3GP65_9SPHI|nr:hypothetical protein [Mucilaginibacter terrae]MDT3401256.1 hypothetical protein [Mucilaginibacter terrae]